MKMFLLLLAFPATIGLMTRYKAIISYDGHDFAGFQRQPHARSVQEEIEKTLTRINKGQLWDKSYILIYQKSGMKRNCVLPWIRRRQKILILLVWSRYRMIFILATISTARPMNFWWTSAGLKIL